MNLDFERIGKEWHVVLPDWTGDHSALQMVAGADIMLDEYNTENKDLITMRIETRPFRNSDILDFVKDATVEYGEGAFYSFQRLINDQDCFETLYIRTIWLCAVMEHIFIFYPESLYIQKIDTPQ